MSAPCGLRTNTITSARRGYVVGYGRISNDPRDRRAGVQNQRAWFEAWAAEHLPGLPAVWFEDNDITGTSAERGGYQDLRAFIADERIGYVWCRDQSRLTRDKQAWFDLAAELRAQGIETIWTHDEGEVEIDSLITDIRAVIAAWRVSEDRKHLMAKQDRDAEQGIPAGGSLPFGYARAVIDGQRTYVQDPEQAELLRQAAADILAGRSVTAIAREWGRRGVRSNVVKQRHLRSTYDPDTGTAPEPVGGWPTEDYAVIATAGSLRSCLMNPSVAGLRQHRRQLAGKGNWYERRILDEPTWREVCAKLEDAGRRRRADAQRGGAQRRTYLLSAALRCASDDERHAERGGRMSGSRSKGHPVYICPVCGRSIVIATAERVVIEALEAAQAAEAADELHPSAAELLGAVDPDEQRAALEAELAELDAKRVDLAGRFATMTTAAFDAADSSIADRQVELQAEMAALGDERDAEAWSIREAAEVARDEAADPEARQAAAEHVRAAVRRHLTVSIAPARRGTDPAERVRVVELGRVPRDR